MTNTSIAPYSRNPTKDGHLRGVLDLVLSKFVQNKLDDMLPARVIAYDRQTNMASVQPLIQIVSTLNQITTRAQIASVPVLQLGGGGFVLNFPIKTGDMGWLKSNDRDISLFKQLWAMAVPNTGRKHSFEDAIFIPSVLTGFTIESQDSSNVVLQSLNASVRLSLGDGNACISDESGYSQSPNAILDLQSTTRAFKLPVMSGAQKSAIASPKTGMMVWDTTEGGVSTYNGSMWS